MAGSKYELADRYGGSGHKYTTEEMSTFEAGSNLELARQVASALPVNERVINDWNRSY